MFIRKLSRVGSAGPALTLKETNNQSTKQPRRHQHFAGKLFEMANLFPLSTNVSPIFSPVPALSWIGHPWGGSIFIPSSYRHGGEGDRQATNLCSKTWASLRVEVGCETLATCCAAHRCPGLVISPASGPQGGRGGVRVAGQWTRWSSLTAPSP